MKKLILNFFLFFIFFSGYIFTVERIEVNSKISEVIVYPESALVSRVVSCNLKKGNYELIFSDIIPEIDENSLKISIIGKQEVKLYGAKLKKEFLEEFPSKRIKELKEGIQMIEDEIKREENFKKLILEEKSFLDSIRLFSSQQIPKDLVTKIPSIKELDEILKFLDLKLKENYSQLIETEIRIRNLINKLDVLKRELEQISGPQKKLKRSIIVDLEVLKDGNFELKVSYLVKEAVWQPIYDARANFEKSEVELVCYGIVKQKTGEEWENVDIYLSTAKPTIGGRMPDIYPWILTPWQPIIRREIGIMENEEKGILKEPKLEVEYGKVEERGISILYKINRKVDIKSDWSEHKIPIFSQVLKGNFQYSTYPRLSNYAYLVTRVTNGDNLQLLSGRVNIFLEGDFVGSSSIENIAPGEEFDLYLGVDENLKVKREQIGRKLEESLFGKIKRITLRYKITLENYKNKKVKIELFEAMPISEDERIKVKIKDLSLEPNQKDWQDKKGIYVWEIELEPKGKKEIYYTIIIEHPTDIQIKGL
ncbi:MAG: mucoidy inhibitor MuiA family protein [Candidatus Omnitrophica bacterium]|nr:mucoidy inhibitor MuiA family protein [Candidatus Omnitrophota bacterium]